MNAHILVVDDNLILARAVAMLLSDEGYSVRMAHTGAAALAALEAEPADIVISDILMPELDGLSLVQALRDRGDAVPVVLISANTVADPLPTGVRFVPKPFDVEAFILTVQEALSAE